MRNQQSYPIFVEQTVVHLVWVEAENAEAAARRVTEYPYAYADKGGDPCDSYVVGRAPSAEIGSYDWDAVYGYTGAADEPDAHVWQHEIHLRDQLRIEHAKTGHPNLDERTNHRGERWCPDCREHVAMSITRPNSSGGDPQQCEAETRSWDHFTPDQMDSYWIRCTLSGAHDEHEDEHTGLTWTDTGSYGSGVDRG